HRRPRCRWRRPAGVRVSAVVSVVRRAGVPRRAAPRGRPRPPHRLPRGLQGDAGPPVCVLFFFQAEDGIRDATVTGVQTCALPIYAPGKPTVLCYAHYDVQPPDPLDEWVSPPFEPTERNNNIYARGAVDDKGQLWMEIKSSEALMKGHNGKLPINVKFIIEGEEEVGGESIAEYVRKEKARLKADFALVCDTELFAPDLPTLCVGLRGLVYTEIEAFGAKTDLH